MGLLRFLIGLPPRLAVAYLRRKGYTIGWNWEETLAEAHDRAFTVAKVAKLDILQDIRNAADKALAEGQSERSFRQNLEPTLKQKGWWGTQETEGGETVQLGSPRRLRTIYRTNMQSAMMKGRAKDFLADVEDRPYWQYVAVLDERTRPMHRRLDGRVFRWDDPFWRSFFPPLGFNCFPEGQRVEAKAYAGSKAFYSGQVVEIATRKRRLTVTANHPILTDRGWVAACQIQESDNLVCAGRHIEGISNPLILGTSAVHDENSESCVEEIFNALSFHGSGSLQPTHLDFYGDGAFFEGEIDVVGADRFLLAIAQATGRELTLKGDFVGGREQSSLPSFRLGQDHRGIIPNFPCASENRQNVAFANSKFLGDRGTSKPLMVEGDRLLKQLGSSSLGQLPKTAGDDPILAQPLFFGGRNSASPLELFLSTPSSELDVTLPHQPIDWVSGTTIHPGKLSDRIAREIEFDDVVSVRKFLWSGHVYDFATVDGVIISDGVITSNCRCRVRALRERDVKRKNLTVESSEGLLSEGRSLLSVRSGIEVPTAILRDFEGDIRPDPGWSYDRVFGDDWEPDLSRYGEDLRAQFEAEQDE